MKRNTKFANYLNLEELLSPLRAQIRELGNHGPYEVSARAGARFCTWDGAALDAQTDWAMRGWRAVPWKGPCSSGPWHQQCPGSQEGQACPGGIRDSITR